MNIILLKRNGALVERAETDNRVDLYAEGCRILRTHSVEPFAKAFTDWVNQGIPTNLSVVHDEFEFSVSR